MCITITRWISVIATTLLFALGTVGAAAPFNQTTHFQQMRADLAKCRDYSVGQDGAMRVQFYANKSSGCGARVSMQTGGSEYGFLRATLQYQVYFPSDHAWGKGGKIHGTMGANSWTLGGKRCNGGVRYDNCHSTRIMFRRNGAALLYLYAPTKCQERMCAKYPDRIQPWCCQPTFPYGIELDTGVVSFRVGAWNNVSVTTVLGVGDTSNVTLRINGRATTVVNIPMQLGNDQSIRATLFQTFYGGHTPDWYPEHDTYAIFRNFRYRDLLPYVPASRDSVRQARSNSEL
jgi:hypothetical protein